MKLTLSRNILVPTNKIIISVTKKMRAIELQARNETLPPIYNVSDCTVIFGYAARMLSC